jgi:hypothetical protein
MILAFHNETFARPHASTCRRTSSRHTSLILHNMRPRSQDLANPAIHRFGNGGSDQENDA